MRTLILAAVLAALPLSALAQTAAPSAADRAMAAGYKALTVCSALKTAEAAGGSRTLASVEANELVGVYPELDGLVRAMPVEIGERQVSVPWDEAMPPRVAVFSPGRGCAIQPVGWTGESPEMVRPGVRVNEPFMVADPHGNAALLNEAVQGAFEGGYGEGVNTTAVLVLQADRVVAEEYGEDFGVDTPQRTWSVGKSLAGTIIGAAVHRGEVDVNAPAAIADWSRGGDPRAAITLDQLMRMASGLTSDTAGNRTDALYFGGVGIDEQVTTWPLIAPPGTRYRYANNDTLLAVLSIAPTFERHPPAALFRRLGMYDTWAETDWRGNYMLSSQVWTTARDLARFGQLYLNDGVVDGERILPEGWRDYVSRPSGPQPGGAQGYGATFWLFNRSEGIPADAISANGNRGQYVIIVPSRNIVIVRRGEDPAGKRFDFVAFTRDILAALD
ncbi:MAG: beta-lactamase family protein [Alphaproteobacteria bacterium]|jgi:CubicO group peptidase (beta-lactamase class C family)|nr:beta-lactamase family protein [Alphaproteobacteria bacterium]MBU2041944.1 beta-lactamase family protein [Alphaproteobacteria bacterium]MBU2125098.1 beta-lactamase family protein [Alphaproteobacteria bacterium]MBU2207186.1 beta-lactamase family protein [Alphaproteobacteria bacterium]MBU2290144.1 beta-lactamase family protein [Alphaproteobacteria bacterium]